METFSTVLLILITGALIALGVGVAYRIQKGLSEKQNTVTKAGEKPNENL